MFGLWLEDHRSYWKLAGISQTQYVFYRALPGSASHRYATTPLCLMLHAHSSDNSSPAERAVVCEFTFRVQPERRLSRIGTRHGGLAA